MKKKKLLFVFGTRPEALKMAPLILKAKADRRFQTVVCLTAQHREMSDQVLDLFRIKPDYDLDLMEKGQTLGDITHKLFVKIDPVFKKENPDLVLVQGDTTTAFATALKAFYETLPVGHIEAGLRSHNKFHPFPEEINRVMISRLGDFHFAPTQEAATNLYNEGTERSKVFITGNTVVDALHWIHQKGLDQNLPLNSKFLRGKRMILVTAHRRENFGVPLKQICLALQDLVRQFADTCVVYPVHPNPKVQEVAHKELKHERIHLLPPVSYTEFLALMNHAHLLLTDSGGVQEEAPSFHKPVLVLRETTERPDGVRLGVAKLVGSSRQVITCEASKLLKNNAAYKKMTRAKNPYGDGQASKRILNLLAKKLK